MGTENFKRDLVFNTYFEVFAYSGQTYQNVERDGVGVNVGVVDIIKYTLSIKLETDGNRKL